MSKKNENLSLLDSVYDERLFDRDRDYWNRYYSKNEGQISTPSSFAIFVSRYLNRGKHLLELGCGNGRDSLYFLKSGLKVTGVDASDYIIAKLSDKFSNNNNADFICNDFVSLSFLRNIKYHYIYSRFTLHAISEKQEDSLLKNVKGLLAENGLFFIEARTIHDELYGKGIMVNKNAYIFNDHYRRFIDPEMFWAKLDRLQYEVLLFEEQTGFSKKEDSDPVLLRCIARLKPD